jgi:hypothetical protein
LSKLIHNLLRKESSPKFLGYFCHFSKTAQSKQSPFGRKFAQAGHPVDGGTVSNLKSILRQTAVSTVSNYPTARRQLCDYLTGFITKCVSFKSSLYQLKNSSENLGQSVQISGVNVVGNLVIFRRFFGTILAIFWHNFGDFFAQFWRYSREKNDAIIY